MKIQDIEKCIEILKGSKVTECSVKLKGTKFYFKRIPEKKDLEEEHTTEEKPGPRIEVHHIRSKYVGKFYIASRKNFELVKVGEKVKKGTPLCMIECLGIENIIKSDVEGEIASINVENGKPVEYGQLLFTIITNGGK